MKMESKVFDQEWTDITIVSMYADRGNVIQREHRVLRADVEKEIAGMMLAQGNELPEGQYKMSNDEFQRHVLRGISTMLSTPIAAEPKVTNEARFLPGSAIREVIIRVNNLGKVLTA